jgi:MFS family permease
LGKLLQVMNSPSLLRALGHRNFRLFFFGQGVSLIGTWMQQVAQEWLVFLLTHSPWWLGLVSFAGRIPSFFLAPVAGVLVDRWNRHRLVLVTQSLSMLQAFLLAWLTAQELVAVWQLVVLSIFLGLVNAFDITARQAFLTEMVERREDLANAIAMNSMLVNGARMVGPAVAGLLLAWAGVPVCFLVNGLSFVAVLAALMGMKVQPRPPAAQRQHLLHELWEGVTYAFGFGPIRALLLLLSLVSLMGMSYLVLLPLFATDVLGGGAETLGLLTAGPGVGALMAALFLASRKTVLGLGRWIAATPGVAGLGLLAFSASHTVWLSWLFLVLVGFATMVQTASTNTVLQTIVEEDKRGRVMSFYTMAFIGAGPLGNLLAGFLADIVGAPNMVRLGAVCCLLGSVVFGAGLPNLRKRIRPIYVRMGILPQIATGIEAATELVAPPKAALERAPAGEPGSEASGGST